MNKSSLIRALLLACLVFSWATLGLMRSHVAYAAPVSFSALGQTYTQDFNALTSGGSWSNDSTISAWYSNRAMYTVSVGDSDAGGLYSFGSTTTPADRALGSISSNSINLVNYGVLIQNNSSNTITHFYVQYTGEQWRAKSASGGPVNNTLIFEYQVGATAPNISSTSGWTAVSALNFDSPIDNGTGSGNALDGNLTANRQTLALTFLVNLPAGQFIMFRWRDVDDSNEDQGLAIDDVLIQPTGPTAVNWAQSSLNVNKTSVKAGDTFMYTLKVADAEGGAYTVTDTMPDYLTILSAPNMTITGQTVSASGTLPPNIPATYQITVQVNHDYVGTISNSALVTDGTVGRELFAPDVQSLHGLYLPLVTR